MHDKRNALTRGSSTHHETASALAAMSCNKIAPCTQQDALGVPHTDTPPSNTVSTKTQLSSDDQRRAMRRWYAQRGNNQRHTHAQCNAHMGAPIKS